MVPRFVFSEAYFSALDLVQEVEAKKKGKGVM